MQTEALMDMHRRQVPTCSVILVCVKYSDKVSTD